MIKRFLERHTLWIGSAAVILPLGALLGLQYFWLVDLQNKSAVAQTAYLQNYLEAVSSRVEYFYRSEAEGALNLPGSLFARAKPEKIARYLTKKKPHGAKALFVVNFVHEE